MITNIESAGIRKKPYNAIASLDVSEAAYDLLVQYGYDPQFGARPMRRAIQKYIVNELAKFLLGNKFDEGDTIRVDADSKGAFTFTIEQAPRKEQEEDIEEAEVEEIDE